jgi:hypothetical protein
MEPIARWIIAIIERQRMKAKGRGFQRWKEGNSIIQRKKVKADYMKHVGA